MVRKKSVASKVNSRKKYYKEKVARSRVNLSWNVLILIMRAIHAFLKCRRDKSIAARLPPNFGIWDKELIPSNCIGVQNENNKVYFPNEILRKQQFQDFNIIKDVIGNIVRKVCRREYDRKRKITIEQKTQITSGTVKCNMVNSDQERKRTWYKNRYLTNASFRKAETVRNTNFFHRKYSKNAEFQSKHKEKKRTSMRTKYHENITFSTNQRIRSNANIFKRYHSNLTFRERQCSIMTLNMRNKYQNNDQYRYNFRNRMKELVMRRYHSDPSTRLKMINRSINHYYVECTPEMRKHRQIYNQNRRIVRKYMILHSHNCDSRRNNVYWKTLRNFRKLNKMGPDYICMCCRITLFRKQVIEYSKEKYLKENMSSEKQERILSYLNYPNETNENWICKLCSEKIKKGEIPSRAIANKLDVCTIPSELSKLNNLEKHLIALRLPFIKIVNLCSGKISSRFAQKGTKGPLHCVPSDVQDTVKTLPRPIDRSMMIRLQLKRRLKYKTIWEEQLINPDDVRNALITLTKTHPGYKNINIIQINENYLTSDIENEKKNENDSVVELMDIDMNEEGNNSADETVTSNEKNFKRMALGDISHIDENEGEVEEDDDVRAKYNVGTDSCTQPADFNDFSLFGKDPYMVAPAEKNKLSSILTDKTIESLAFPHLFPDGKGSYNEDRITEIKWKEYCKTRLFSSDARFAADSTYIFFLQYLGDLKQVFSAINVAFRKKLPMTVKEVLDDVHMKFLMNKDMIYRYLQSIRGSPHFWQQRLKELFAMTRQLGFPTFFITLSCADMRWKEFIDIFSRHSNGEEKTSYTYEEKTKLLRANPVLAARLFEKRLNTFMNLFIKNGARCLGLIKDWYARIEMQFRGSPHAHMPLWAHNAPKYIGVETDEKTRKEIVEFCDKYITTRFPSIEQDMELHNIIKEVQTHSRNHSKSCLKYHKTICRFGFPRPIARQTFICEPIKIDNNDQKERSKKAKEILTELNATMNTLEKEKELTWLDFDNLLSKYNWKYDDYEWALRIVHTKTIIIHKREPNARWINQYNEEMLRAWNANMDIQFILDPYACAKYLMSYTTKPEREMSLLLQETHKECREGNISVREEMKKLTGTFFNHRQVSVQEAIYRATKMPLTYSSRGFTFVPSHSNSCKILKTHKVLKQMDPDDENIYMSNLADKYFDRPDEPEFDICMADFASYYEVISVNRKPKKPRTEIKYLKTLNYAVKKKCGHNAIIRFPYFNRENDRENYFENILSLYLPIRSRDDLKKPFELFYELGEMFDSNLQSMRKVKEIVIENRKKYETHFKETNQMETLFNDLSVNVSENDWAEIVSNKEKENLWFSQIEQEENPDFNIIHKKKNKNFFLDLKQTYSSTDEIKPLLESMNEEQQKVFYHVRDWCVNRLNNPDVEPLRLFITGGAGTGKSHLLKCLHHEATKIFSRKKHLEPDENIDEIHTLITAFTGAAAVNVGGVTIHSAFGIGTQSNSLHENLSCDRLNTYRCKLGTLKLLFVDEVSLIQANLWGAMHSRLSQIMGVHSNTAIFGNVGIIAIGDFYQCSPVASSSIYSTLLWTDHFELIELKINERQKRNTSFAEMLNRMRILKKNETMIDTDIKTLENCHTRFSKKEYNLEALHLYARNNEVDAHNDKMIKAICTDIKTFYEVDINGKEIKSNNSKTGSKMKQPLQLANNARVMITKNISVSDGLANGVMGRIVGFIENNNQVSNILIKCDLSNVGRSHRITCLYCHGKDTICVVRENDNTDREMNSFRSKKATKQFPVRLSWAVTIHKAQGITVDEIVISTKTMFGAGMAYTAASRVRVGQGLFLSDLYLNKFYCNENVDKVLSQMKKMNSKSPIFHNLPYHLNIFSHNIESLQSNFKGLQNHYLTDKADVICLTESWLIDKNNNFETFKWKDFNFIFKNRSSAFQSNHPIKSQKGGGIAIFVKENLIFKRLESCKYLNLEYLSIEIEKYDIIIITCYRSPKQNKKEFIDNLIEYLKEINLRRKIVLLGDFNEDTFQTQKKTIESELENLGLINIFKNIPTTNSLTSLDCVYSNFLSKTKHEKAIVGTFFSFHEALTVSINTVEKLTDVNVENQIDFEEIINNSIQYNTTHKRKRLTEQQSIKKISKRKHLLPLTSSFDQTHRQKQLHFLNTIKNKQQERTLNHIGNFFSIQDQLMTLGLKNIDVLGDGNCFFRALSLQLYENENEHYDLRCKAIDYLIYNSNDFISYINRDIDPTIDSYIERMSTSGTYADFLMISCVAFAIHKNIVVHQKAHKPLLIPGSDFLENQLHVLYLPNKHHYECVLSIDGNVAIIPAEQILFT